jgi:hypothetical protein
MKKFKILLEGNNYLLRVDEKPSRKFGFFMTFFVEARNAEEAEGMAVELLKNDSKLRDSIENNDVDPPTVIVDAIKETHSFEGCKLPRTGLVLFDEEKETEI